MRKTLIAVIYFSVLGFIFFSCQNKEQIQFQSYMSSGKEIYQTACLGCHGENGEGLNMLAPPLTDVSYLTNNKTNLACIIKNGLEESVTINGKVYSEKMPAFPEFTPIDIAQVMVYITNSFGNKQGIYSYPQVALDLKNCKNLIINNSATK